ncbi:hypothetical protein OUY22_00645 [Nonomuraea sp. MCN248]|uniref:DUF4265 domain-containing protein n=1 Tax=Nonomuraea corallina TaxID=2989783 RepID=A0ABT4S405_9ACTN|nr:hypothetical protein [Nonomuraea corallina]MDA0631909.1 hypothetical protein [Nonomuraea corallina]
MEIQDTEPITHQLETVNFTDESRLPCVVTLQEIGDDICELHFDQQNAPRLVFRSPVDFEDPLTELRQELERQGLLLLCNRFRRNAFVSSMARQMSTGLSCYLVTRGLPVDPGNLVDSLGPAPRETVVLAKEGARYIEEWIAGFDEDDDDDDDDYWP